MPRLIWTANALSDVHRLYRFLTPKDPAAARRAVKAIETGVKILTHQPRLGRPVEDMDAEYREWSITFGSGSYIVLYRVQPDAVVVLAVRHRKEAGY